MVNKGKLRKRNSGETIMQAVEDVIQEIVGRSPRDRGEKSLHKAIKKVGSQCNHCYKFLSTTSKRHHWYRCRHAKFKSYKVYFAKT